MKILLVNPPVPSSYYNREFYIPSSIVSLAAVLKKNGNIVHILDMRTLMQTGENDEKYYKKCLSAKISTVKPDLVGFSCLFSGNFPDILKFAEFCKDIDLDLPVVIGGIHPTIYAKEILENCLMIDYVLIGEAEESFPLFIKCLENNGLEYNKIDGFAYRDNGRVIIHHKANFIKNLDELPMPSYEMIDFNDYYVDTTDWHNPKQISFKTSVPIISSRSCPNSCNFCSMYSVMGPRWRARSAENVVDEIAYVYHNYGQSHFSFMDDNFTFNKKRTLEICNLIKKKDLNIHFETPNGISIKTLDKDVVGALVEAGLTRVSLAIESGSDYIRNKIMGKHLKREKIYEVMELCQDYSNLYVKAFFIIGLPEETFETLEDTYNMINDITVDRIYLSNVVPYAGSKVYKQALHDDLLVNLNPKYLYKSGDMYNTNYDRFFIKPYALAVSDLREFRARCDKLILVKRELSIDK